jgi:hypothetical protein
MTAKGITNYSADGTLAQTAWQNAKDFVKNYLLPGWDGSTSVYSTLTGKGIWQDSVDFDNLSTNAYNRVLQETQDELDGTYSLTESFLLSVNNYTEDVTASVKRLTEEPLTTCTIALQGTIRGLFVNLHDYETKLTNANTRWTALQPTLFAYANSLAPPGVILNLKPLQGSFDVDKNNGIITYNYEFSDRKLVNDTYEIYTIDRKIAYQIPFVTVTVSGKIQGVLYPGENDYTLRYQRALAQWNIVKLLLYARALTKSSSLTIYPIEDSVTDDQFGGSISYSYTFDNRPFLSVIDDYGVSKRFSREDGRTIISDFS